MPTTTPLLKNHSYGVTEPLILENGEVLRDLRIHYTTYGNLNEEKSNVVWVFHALTANSNPVEWWPGLVGESNVLNPKEYFIICANMIGSCYGSTEPENFDFPALTIRDMVKAHKLLRQHLSIEKIKLGIGGSMGGQHLLQWAVEEPELFEIIVPLATNARHSAWGIAFNEAQRMALHAAADLKEGLRAARAIGMLSYRNMETYNATQTDMDGRSENFSASSYQQYQGKKLADRFSPFSYHYLSKGMDSHNVGIGFGSVENALKSIRSRALVIGIESDLLFPVAEQKLIADHIEHSQLHVLPSLYGHDGFLIEVDQISAILKTALEST